MLLRKVLRMRRAFLFTLFALVLVGASSAQSLLKTPAEFLGYELGESFTRHHRVVDYVRYVADASSNVEIVEYGSTNEGRPLIVAFISTAQNLARREEIQRNNLRLAGLETGDLQGDALSVVWLSYNVHGNESVSTEASMATLHELADTDNAKTQAWLTNTIVILDPTVNPDGRDRYVNWYNQALGMTNNVNPDAAEHFEPGPGGRTNHYNFDLNRDWSWLTQVETKARIRLYNQWMPHVHVDFHEQGVDSPYYFAPAAEPYHEVITAWQREFQTIIGRNHAKYFDENGWLYFTRQVFDLFYPGYGDTFPTYNGAIGMTYEQAGGGRAGLGIVAAETDTLTLADRIAHHHATGLSTIEMVSVHHDRIITEFKDFFDRARNNPSGPYRTYVVKSAPGDGRTAALADHLKKLGIEYGTLSDSQQAKGFSYRTGKTVSFEISEGDLVVSAYQSRSTLLRVLFEPVSAISDSITYDITAWALPYAYDLTAFATSERISPDADFKTAGGALASSTGRAYAYLVPWSDVADVRFLSALLQKGIKVRYAEKSFEIEGKTYAPGTLIVTRTGNEKLGDQLESLLNNLAESHGQNVTAVGTGFVDKGSDFGSGDVHYIKRPNIAVLRGSPVSSSSSGQIWHYFDQQIHYPVTMMTPDAFGRVDLEKYDVFVLPSGSYGRILSEEQLKRVTAWVRAGGRLIAMGSAAEFFVGKEGFALKKKKESGDKKKDDKEDAAKEADTDTLKVYGERRRDRVTRSNNGSIYRVTVDNSHPLAFGFGGESFVLKRGTSSPAYMDGTGVWNVGVLKDHSLVSGQVGHEAAQKIEESLAFGVQDMGRGSIVYMVDDPLFRGFWYSGRLLMGNAIFLVGQR